MSYKHITPDQRNELSALKRTKIKQKEIAQILGKNRTTIYRELKRNKNKDGKYDARIAKQKTKERRIKSNQRFRKIENNRWLREYIQKNYNCLFKKETANNNILPINQSLRDDASLKDSNSFKDSDKLFTTDFYIVLNREYKDSEEYSASINKALLHEFGQKGLCFQYQKHEIFGTISYPILAGHILSDVKYKIDNDKLLVCIINRPTVSVSNVAPNKEVIFVTLNDINEKPSEVIVYLNENVLNALGGIHEMVIWD